MLHISCLFSSLLKYSITYTTFVRPQLLLNYYFFQYVYTNPARVAKMPNDKKKFVTYSFFCFRFRICIKMFWKKFGFTRPLINIA